MPSFFTLITKPTRSESSNETKRGQQTVEAMNGCGTYHALSHDHELVLLYDHQDESLSWLYNTIEAKMWQVNIK
jgi:hypothetical protein